MKMQNLPLSSFAIGGYRSFGKSVQRFAKLSQINLFIGQNNCGKSNILRFLHDIYPRLSSNPIDLKLTHLDRHIPTGASFNVGIAIPIHQEPAARNIFLELISPKIPDSPQRSSYIDAVLTIFNKKAQLDNSNEFVWFDFSANGKLQPSNWKDAFNGLEEHRLEFLWRSMTGQTGGSKDKYWYPQVLERITPTFQKVHVKMIPAIRKIGEQNTASDEFSGEGIIERLAKLQNPDVQNRKEKDKFERINKFLQSVIDNETAEIEVPYQRDTILIHMDGKTLPLEYLGTGIHEVIILAAAATILESTVICMEEPELHLNPILQKKLMRYLLEATNNQYFITTHSAALMDTPSAEVYHISIKDGESIGVYSTSDKQRSAICEDLGYHPSDLLQTNCVIWVEGPSDRIYINYWINALAPQFIEGIHYSIMFYGGRLASHLTGEDINKHIEDFVSLRRLNRRGVIVIDSDIAKKDDSINETKTRLREEFDFGPGYAWITAGREIENYLDPVIIKEAIFKTYPSATSISTFGQFEQTLSITTKSGKASSASKVDVARYIVENAKADFSHLDLKIQVQNLIDFIRASNPSFTMLPS
jgi:energy-coupling factor transporter ATP-binding protein EcfA2